MASSPILHRGSYDHYKTRTKVFINWLTEAARKCCKLEDVVGALKDRAGKRAKKNGEEILLTTQEIISLCQKVAEKKKVMIPAWILRLLKNVIASRTEYTAFYSALSAAEGSALDRSNAGHAHFIDVLQQAHDIFAALGESRITKRNKLVSTPTLKSLRNLFEHLKVGDAPGAQRGGDEVEAAAEAAAAEAEAELEEEEIEQRAADTPRISFKVKVDRKEEILVQLVHLLGDCETLRMEIEDTFKEYVCGEVTHEVACTVASIGFGLIRRTCERFTDQHSKFGDYAYMLKFLGFRMEQHETLGAVSLECTSGHRREDSANDAPDAKTSEETRPLLPPNHDTTSLLCASGAGIMLGLLEEFQSPRDDHEANRHGFAQLLHDGIPELQKLKENPASNPAILKPAMGFWWGDEFLSGILNYTFGDERGLPIWLAVVTQCYRNIYDILGGRMDCGMENDSKRWKRFLDMIESAEEFQYCEGETPVVRIIDEWSGWFNLLKSNFSGPHGTKKPFMFDSDGHGPPPMHLITKLPTVTAGMTLSPTANMYTHGYSIANTNLVIHCAAHLYAACRSTKLIRDDLHWRDMDFILEHHKLYTDIVPGADPYSMINHFYISLGVRRSTLAKAKADIDRRRFKVRWIAQKSPFLVKYASAAVKVQREGREVRNLTVVDAMLEALTHCFDLELRHKSAKLKQKRYTPIELLSAFKRILIEDEPERNFNMIGFSQQCSAFVAEVRAQLSGGDILGSCTPIDLAASILLHASRQTAEGMPASESMLPIVSKILEKMVVECGDKYVQEARKWSSG